MNSSDGQRRSRIAGRRGLGEIPMSCSGQVLDNQVTGERFVFHATSDDTAGRLLEFDLVVEPHGRVPGGHVHPGQQESFEVLEGTMKFRRGLRTVIARPGDLVVVTTLGPRPVLRRPGHHV
jgi:quercetin dioxygenase-like cupin family protein